MFTVEDEAHAEPQGEFEAFEDAMGEVQRRASIPWDSEPNVAPCLSWKTCGRRYEIVEYDARSRPWRELQRVLALEVSAAGVKWQVSPDA